MAFVNVYIETTLLKGDGAADTGDAAAQDGYVHC